jgi:hypothetical protein
MPVIRRDVLVLATTICVSVPLFAQQSTESRVEGPVGARVDSALRTLEAQGMSGVFLVRKNGATVLEKGYGLAIRNLRLPPSRSCNSPSTASSR